MDSPLAVRAGQLPQSYRQGRSWQDAASRSFAWHCARIAKKGEHAGNSPTRLTRHGHGILASSLMRKAPAPIPMLTLGTGLFVVPATICVVGFPLKRVVPVKSLPREKNKARGEEICRNHQRPPSFVLGNVDCLMFSGNVERSVRLAEHDMPERQCKGKLAMRQSMNEPFDSTVIKFDRPSRELNATAEKKADQADQQSDERIRRRPDDSGDLQ